MLQGPIDHSQDPLWHEGLPQLVSSEATLTSASPCNLAFCWDGVMLRMAKIVFLLSTDFYLCVRSLLLTPVSHVVAQTTTTSHQHSCS